MRAISKYRPLTYVIESSATRYDLNGVPIGRTDGFYVEFNGHREGVFDSALIDDPVKRKRAEEFLMSHSDRGTFFHVERDTPVKDSKKTKVKGCIATVHVKGQPASVCGKPAVDGLDYCIDCAEGETAVAS